ncbi:hypothetical protein [Butyricimonas sp.]|uniref:hypothetical protein n=1 Tax=Butyricimonas sp. TaxID=1969738 RepID=UPI0025B8011D|nr:hypothetical protein [Butyricimonas sp.]
MKNRFLWLLILGMALFSGCSDDDDPDYSGNYGVDKLKLTLSGIAQANKEVELTDDAIILKNVIAGEEKTTVPVVFDGANFSGKVTNSDRAITVAGVIKENVLLLDVTLKIVNDIVGTWNIYDQNITAEIKAPEGTVLVFMGNEMDAAQLEMILPMLIGSFPQAYLKDVTFKDNGYLVANYDANGNAGKKDEESTWVSSPEGAVKWYVKNGQVYLLPDMAIIQGSRSEMGGSDILTSILANGLPLNFTIANDGLHVYVTKEQMLPFMDIASTLVDMIEEPNYILSMAKLVIPEMKQDMQKCSVFNLGMKMMRPE